MAAKSVASATNAPFGSRKSRSNCFGMFPLMALTKRLMQSPDHRVGGFYRTSTMLMSPYGIGHRDHRGHRTADRNQIDPMPPMPPMPDGCGDTEHAEALSAGKRLRERRLALVRL